MAGAGRRGHRVLRTAGAAVVAGALTMTLCQGATADPGVPGEASVGELLTRLQDLYRRTEEATERYNATEEELTAERSEAMALSEDLARVRGALHRGREAAGLLARQQYQGSSELSPYLRLLLARDARGALDRGQVIRRMAQGRVAVVKRLSVDERRADALATRSRHVLDRRITLAEQQRRDRDEVRERLAEVEGLLASLSPEQVAAVERLEGETADAAQEELLRSGTLGADDAPPSPQGRVALRFAVAQVGKPYEWGAEGPRSYDCSGLTWRAWSQAGRSIPRTSQEQWRRLPRVSLRELRPGDLVVYYPRATHVAMYVGNGEVVQALRPGERVKITPLAAQPVLGAVRPDGESA